MINNKKLKEVIVMVFKNLSEEKAKKLYDEFIAKGLSEDDAFTEVYSIECNMDEEDN